MQMEHLWENIRSYGLCRRGKQEFRKEEAL